MIRDNEQSNFKRWLLGYIPATVFVGLIGIGTLISSTYFLSYNSMQTMEKWSCEGRITHGEEWDVAHKNLVLTNKLMPWDADINMGLGNLYEWKAAGESTWSDTSKKMRSKAIAYYAKAIEQRPTWANVWIKLAQTMLLNRQITDDTFYAITMGFKYGQWQPELRDRLFQLTLGIWGNLPEHLKKQTRLVVKKSLTNDFEFKKMAVLAMRFKWIDELIPLVEKQEDIDFLNAIKANPKLLTGDVKKFMGQSRNAVCI